MIKPNANMFASKPTLEEQPRESKKNVSHTKRESTKKRSYSKKNQKTNRNTTERQMSYRCNGPEGERKYVIATSVLEAGEKCQKMFGFWPIEVVEKLPFKKTEHLTNRPFAGLDQLLKEAGK